LDAGGYWVSEVMDHGFILSVYSFDPNNIAIEFSWSNPEIDLRKKPRMLDLSPSLTAMQGPDSVKEQRPDIINPTTYENKKVYPGEGSEFRNRNNKW
ncbi:MAG: VOC family protein, partial [Desulfovibrionales bacterium]|nr:VOC family protein [Desulfovibrionales bacterium]